MIWARRNAVKQEGTERNRKETKNRKDIEKNRKDMGGMTDKLYELMNWPQIEEIIYSECDNPHELLGPHRVGNHTLVQAFFPQAEEVSLVFE